MVTVAQEVTCVHRAPVKVVGFRVDGTLQKVGGLVVDAPICLRHVGVPVASSLKPLFSVVYCYLFNATKVTE